MATTNRVFGMRCARVAFSGGTKGLLPEPRRVQAALNYREARHHPATGDSGPKPRLGSRD
jgi:hypothetical protein